MTNTARITILLLACCNLLAAGPLSLTFVPASQTALVGQTVMVDVFVGGLTNPPSVGAFDLDVSFDPAVLSPAAVSFGSLLGVPGIEALTDFAFLPGVVDFAAVSLLTAAQLDLLQEPGFTLATLSFGVIGAGVSALSFSQVVIDDAFGGKLPVEPTDGSVTGIPEPSTPLLIVSGILLLVRRFDAAVT